MSSPAHRGDSISATASSVSQAPSQIVAGRFTPLTTDLEKPIAAEDRSIISAALAPMANFKPLRRRAEIDLFIGPNLLPTVVARLRRALSARPAQVFTGEDAMQRYQAFVVAAAAAVREEQRAAATFFGGDVDKDAAASSSDGEVSEGSGSDGEKEGAADREAAEAGSAEEAEELARTEQEDKTELLAGLAEGVGRDRAASAGEAVADSAEASLSDVVNASAAHAAERGSTHERGRQAMDIPAGFHARASFYERHALPLLGAVAEAQFAEQVSAARLMRRSADLSSPHMWYPRARAIKRRIIFHAGPTNSGKTYRALQALKNAHSGACDGHRFVEPLRCRMYAAAMHDGWLLAQWTCVAPAAMHDGRFGAAVMCCACRCAMAVCLNGCPSTALPLYSSAGIYCGPLRLLALEVFESLNSDGVPASLQTGQERRDMPFARHMACTVELMATGGAGESRIAWSSILTDTGQHIEFRMDV